MGARSRLELKFRLNLPTLALSSPRPISAVAISAVMSVASESQPFEGPEKLLEIWFSPSVESLSPSPVASAEFPSRENRLGADGQAEEWQGLRRVPREVWEDMLDIVKCKVLSFVEGDDIDAYLLRSVQPAYSCLSSPATLISIASCRAGLVVTGDSLGITREVYGSLLAS